MVKLRNKLFPLLLLILLLELKLVKFFLLLLKIICLHIEEKVFPATLTFPVIRDIFDFIKFSPVAYVYHKAGDSDLFFCKKTHVYRVEFGPFDKFSVSGK